MYRREKYYILLFVFMAVSCSTFFSCNNDFIKINVYMGGSTSDELFEKESDSTKVRVNFTADIDYMSTRATGSEAMGTERYVTIYAYTDATSSTSSILADQNEYYTKTAGVLTAVSGAMYLNVGSTYSLYAVGVNTENVPVPVFNGGFTEDINNGNDYVWEGIWDVTPKSDSTLTYDLDMIHCCAQILIDLVVETGITVNSVSSVSITPPDTSEVIWDMFNSGQIGPASGLYASSNTDNLMNLGFKKTAFGFRSAGIILPIQDTANFYCQFVLNIDNEVADRTYEIEFPIYQYNMQAGYAYKYNLTLENDTVIFNSVGLEEWHIIDVNGTPVIPVQVDSGEG